MDQSAFDRVSQLFAAKAARRSALAGTAGAAGAAVLAALPEAEAKPGSGKAGAAKKKGRKPGKDGKTEFLFVQTAGNGTLADNGDGTFDLVLEDHRGGTIFFSDRPQRVFGVTPTDRFLEGLGFSPANPPNAALLVDAGDAQDVAIVELLDPAYDPATDRLTYTIRILADYPGGGLDHLARQAGDNRLPTAFGEASLFIDDCQDYACSNGTNDGVCWDCTIPVPDGTPAGRCWNWDSFSCGECYPGQLADVSDACKKWPGDFHPVPIP